MIVDQLTQRANMWAGQAQTLGSSRPSQPASIQYRAELRFERTTFTLSAPVEPTLLKEQAGHAQLIARLSQAYQRRFGSTPEDVAVELVSLRAIASISAAGTKLERFDPREADASAALAGQEQVYFDGSFMRTAFYSREKLQAGNRIHGPAIVTQTDTTTVI